MSSSSNNNKENRQLQYYTNFQQQLPNPSSSSRHQSQNTNPNGSNKPHQKPSSGSRKKKNGSKKTTDKYNDQERPSNFQMNLTDYLFTMFLTEFLLTEEQLYQFGYPISNAKDKAVFFCNNPWSKRTSAFTPRPLEQTSASASVIQGSKPEERTCTRCFSLFYILDNKYVKEEECVHHWGKLVYNKDVKARLFTCCNGAVSSAGCSTAAQHVWSGVTFGVNGPFSGFVRTFQQTANPAAYCGVTFGINSPFSGFVQTSQQPASSSAYSIDCEMCYTITGMEVTKVSVVGTDGRCVYDSFIRPENKIIDYNTRFSGISAKDLDAENGSVKNLQQVQKDLLGFIGKDTILIGHGLENDLRGLRIIHKKIVDTAVVFQHEKGFPYRRSLKDLVETFLKGEIQRGNNGHDSLEDARRCMALMINKVCIDFMLPMFWVRGM